MGDVRRLSGLYSWRGARTLLRGIGTVANLDRDAAGRWSLTLPLPATPRPTTSQQRAALVALLLAVRGTVRVGELVGMLGIDRRNVYAMLSLLSVVLPIYIEDSRQGVWSVCYMREGD